MPAVPDALKEVLLTAGCVENDLVVMMASLGSWREDHRGLYNAHNAMCSALVSTMLTLMQHLLSLRPALSIRYFTLEICYSPPSQWRRLARHQDVTRQSQRNERLVSKGKGPASLPVPFA